MVADGGALDADGAASLLLGLDLFLHSLLFGTDGSHGVGHSLELLLVYVMKVIHTRCEYSVHQVIAVDILDGCFIYHGDDFTKEGELLVLKHGGWCRS